MISQALLDQLSDEHLAVKETLARLKAACRRAREGDFDPQQFDDVLARLRAAREHHALEERELFPEVIKSGCPAQGGPNCTLFMGLRIEWDPVGAVLREIGKESAKCLGVPQTSFVSIPLEEHFALELALEELERRVETCKIAREPGARDRLARLGFLTHDLLDVHVRKEEECLFPMLRDRLRGGP